MGNILKSELDCTCAEFLERVYGPRSKPCTEAVKTMFASVLTRSSTLVKELSAPLRTGGLGWLVVDRGMDDARFIHAMKRDGRTAVIRIKDMKRDVFGNGRTIDASLADLDFRKTHLNTYRGAMRSEVRCAVGVMQYCADPQFEECSCPQDQSASRGIQVRPEVDLSLCCLGRRKAFSQPAQRAPARKGLPTTAATRFWRKSKSFSRGLKKNFTASLLGFFKIWDNSSQKKWDKGDTLAW